MRDSGFHHASTPLLALPEGAPPALMTAINDEAGRILNQHGLPAFTMPRNAALAHEAGHAIVAAHEGMAIRRVTVFSRCVSGVELWGGLCLEAGGWTTNNDTSADDDLRRARFIIAGLAGEAITGTDKPGSSLDELFLSQLVGLNAAVKLDDPSLSDDDYRAFAERLWHEQVWTVTLAILRANWEPFNQIVQLLHQKQSVQGARLRHALAQVRGIAS
jgi:hypothetical protein